MWPILGFFQPVHKLIFNLTDQIRGQILTSTTISCPYGSLGALSQTYLPPVFNLWIIGASVIAVLELGEFAPGIAARGIAFMFTYTGYQWIAIHLCSKHLLPFFETFGIPLPSYAPLLLDRYPGTYTKQYPDAKAYGYFKRTK